MKVLVIHETNSEVRTSVIGVADSTENAYKLMKEYYGEYELLVNTRDSSLEWSQIITIKTGHKSETLNIWTEWFNINEIQ